MFLSRKHSLPPFFMQRCSLIVLASLLSFPLQAQLKRTNVDSIMATLKIDDSDDPEDIALDVTKPFKTDSEKVRGLYYWVTENIAYDYKMLRNGIPPIYGGYDAYYDFMITRTLQKKKGVCGQYAMLFAELCKYARIRCVVVEGWGLQTPYYPLGILAEDVSNHAWNAVRINGNWYLLDLTWASGTCNGKLTRFIRQRNDDYYLTPPEKFILDHHPENKEWQLLAHPYSMWTFIMNARKNRR